MATQYCCSNKERRELVRADAKWNGIDYLEVEPIKQTELYVHFLHDLPGQPNGVPAPPALEPMNVVIEGGVRVCDIRVDDVKSKNNVLTVRIDKPGDYSPYRLRLVSSPGDTDTPPPGFDQQLAEVEFSFKVCCPSDFDCQPTERRPLPEQGPALPIDYLSKDYASFRQLMLDRLSVVMPDWRERNPADLGMALVELLAYAADRLSYYQDAAATEAYLGTARRRISLRRHARLLDYQMHEGCNARVWVQVQVDKEGVALKKGTKLLTRLDGQQICYDPDSAEYKQALTRKPNVFELMHDVAAAPETDTDTDADTDIDTDTCLYSAHNEIFFHTWGETRCCLPKGATRATLYSKVNDPLKLRKGDVLIFEEVRGPASGRREDADPAHRHAVRLIGVKPWEDPLFPAADGTKPRPVLEIEWAPEDALPFPLCLWEVEDPDEPDAGNKPVSVARGNIVLADHGETVDQEDQPETLQVPAGERFRPQLEQRGITHRVPYDRGQGRKLSARETIEQCPRAALPAVTLREKNDQTAIWTAQRDLLGSSGFAREFVVEMEEDGEAVLRFGDDILGREPAPGACFLPHYRIGNGRAGNVGAGTIAHLVTAQTGIIAVRNPMPAHGGIDPEPSQRVRLVAPQAFRTQERAVTEADYVAAAEQHLEVQKAVAVKRWTGSWPTFFVSVDRKGGRAVDAAFEEDLRGFLERFRLAGHDVEIEPPYFVPLQIVLKVHVAVDYYRAKVKEALLEAFSAGDLPGGRRGFFHPDNLTFGQPVYHSKILAAAMEVAGVQWAQVVTFERQGGPPPAEPDRIAMGPLEIARLDNDPSMPENGWIEFEMEGGR